MKRVWLHILFWLCYYLLYATMSFLWDKGVLTNWPVSRLLAVSSIGSLLDIIPQIIFPYFLIYHGINKIVKKKGNLFISVVEIVTVFFLCILVFRCFTNYIELPYLYKSLNLETSLFDVRRIFGAMVDIGFATGLMLAVKSILDQLEAKDREKNLTKEKLETELKFLRNQTNPHFLLNTLNNIYALARKKSDETAEVVMRLSELLRFMLYESNSSRIQLSDEIKVLEDYLELETIRYNERLTISFQKEIDKEYYQITPLLLLPFLENAFKHGVSETRFESFINIYIKVKDEMLDFEIENSKDTTVDFCPDNIGLNNIKRQLELTYSDYKLDVDNKNNTFHIHLFINLNSYVEI